MFSYFDFYYPMVRYGPKIGYLWALEINKCLLSLGFPMVPRVGLYKYWMQTLFDLRSLETNQNIQRERIDRLEEIIYGGYV